MSLGAGTGPPPPTCPGAGTLWPQDRHGSHVGPSTLSLTFAPAGGDVWHPWGLIVEFRVDGS